jgi:hypothetical protein
MRRLVLALLLTATPLLAAAPRVEPNVVSPRGGTEVRLRGIAVCSGCPVMVIVDGTAHAAVAEDATTIRFTAPAHEPGAARLAVVTDGYRDAGSLFYDFEREELMIPIAFDAKPGAYGAQWVTDILLDNSGDEPIPLGPYVCPSLGSLFACSIMPLTIAPHTTLRYRGQGDEWSPARTFVPPVEMLGKFTISVRVRDASRTPEGGGTMIPVVRRDDWRQVPFSLIHVPTDPQYRAWLRVYTYASKVMVRVYSESGEELDARMFRNYFPTDSFHFAVDNWADVLSSPRVRAEKYVRVFIEPEFYHYGLTWAMLTLTDNATQQVLVYAPQ